MALMSDRPFDPRRAVLVPEPPLFDGFAIPAEVAILKPEKLILVLHEQ